MVRDSCQDQSYSRGNIKALLLYRSVGARIQDSVRALASVLAWMSRRTLQWFISTLGSDESYHSSDKDGYSVSAQWIGRTLIVNGYMIWEVTNKLRIFYNLDTTSACVSSKKPVSTNLFNINSLKAVMKACCCCLPSCSRNTEVKNEKPRFPSPVKLVGAVNV